MSSFNIDGAAVRWAEQLSDGGEAGRWRWAALRWGSIWQVEMNSWKMEEQLADEDEQL